MFQLLLLANTAFAQDLNWKPDYLRYLSITKDYEDTVYIDNLTVAYDSFHENIPDNNIVQKILVERLIRDSYDFSIQKSRDLNVVPKDCKDDMNVHIIQLGSYSLNTDSFRFWRNINGYLISNLQGLYDPTPEVYRHSVLIHSIVPSRSKYVLFHELAHYWYDRFCIYDKSDMKTETFAKSVENAYIQSGL